MVKKEKAGKMGFYTKCKLVSYPDIGLNILLSKHGLRFKGFIFYCYKFVRIFYLFIFALLTNSGP
jgi:hypothetical protein